MTQVFDRKKGELFQEKVFGAALIDWAYGNSLGRRVTARPSVQRWISKAVGIYQDSRPSRRAIVGFCAQYGIDLDDFEAPDAGFESFNDFFIRNFKAGKREFPQSPGELGSPAEGRLSVFHLNGPAIPLVIKGVPLSVAELVGLQSVAENFTGGHAFVFRLCPVDYHRFHFPDSGRPDQSRRIQGNLHSVNPSALARWPRIFLENERQLSLFSSEHFGTLALIEVGALCVGRIVQTYDARAPVVRGQEKGFFAFGGSTCILLSQAGRLKPGQDLIEKTAQGLESLVRLGEVIGNAGA